MKMISYLYYIWNFDASIFSPCRRLEEMGNVLNPYMIKYDENVPNGLISYDGCTHGVGDQLACANQQAIDRDYSLQAHLIKGTRLKD